MSLLVLRKKSHLQHFIMLLLGGLLAVIWVAVVWNHYRIENRETEVSFNQTATLALLFAKHASSKFSEIDHELQGLRSTWANHPLELKDDIRASGSLLGNTLLQTSIIDAEGFLVFSTLGLPKSSLYLGDREHFKVHQDSGQDALFVSRPVKGRVSGKWSIQMTRPIFDKGKFAGVIVMSANLDFFTRFYVEGSLGKDGVATIIRDTGEVMARSIGLQQYVGKVVKPSPYADPGAPLHGSFRRASQSDGIERLYSYVRLPDYGLSVVIGHSVAERLESVHSVQHQILLGTTCLTLITLLMAWQLLRTLKRKEDVQQALAESQVSLQASHALLENLSEHVPGMIYQYRLLPNGNFTVPYASRGIQALYKVTPEQVREDASLLITLIHPDDRDAIQESIAESARTLQQWEQEYRVILPQQGLRWVMGRSQPKKLDDGSILWHGFATDITESKKNEAVLQTVIQELETFSYSVSHDLRSPLTTIGGFSALLAKKLVGNDNEKARHYLSRIQFGALQMERLIADLLALAKVARAPMKHEPVNLSAMASSITQDLQARHPERQVTLQIEKGLRTHGDAGLLRAALENLLGNAWKYSAKQPAAMIRVGQQTDTKGTPVFFVQDNGVGFDMAYADKLFQAFERLHTEAEFAGTGIGLATVSRIIVRHGGRIWAESTPGLGATFFFTLG